MSTMQLPTQPGPPTPTPLPDAPAGSPPVEPVYDEQIAEIVGRLEQRYPGDQISRADLEGRVRGFHRQFNTVRIRSFVSVFVERLVRRSIDQPSVGGPRAFAPGTRG